MFNEIFELSRSAHNTKPLFVRNSKIMEELGEFSEALMHKEGHLPHKTMKEPLAGEAADVIICVLDTFAAANPELSISEVSSLLQRHLEKKTLKWSKMLLNGQS
jgi:NTP pyrophosphatase (non-canonical NTP hydrolase)